MIIDGVWWELMGIDGVVLFECIVGISTFFVSGLGDGVRRDLCSRWSGRVRSINLVVGMVTSVDSVYYRHLFVDVTFKLPPRT